MAGVAAFLLTLASVTYFAIYFNDTQLKVIAICFWVFVVLVGRASVIGIREDRKGGIDGDI